MINSITDADLLNALPDTNFSITLSGIKAEVQITRDTYGIPHIKSETAEDAFFGQGFATAQDRLWHMESDRRRAYGTWAELVGEKEKESDIMMRKFQIKDSSIRDLQVLNKDSVAMLKSYASGVNAFIQETKALPIEFTITNSVPEKWLPEDSISVYKVRHIMMGVFEGKMWRAQLLRHFGPERTAELLRGYQRGQLLIIPPSEIFQGPELDGLDELESGLDSIDLIREIPESGSNSWVLDGSRTKSGLPLLSGDPHRGLDTPNCYYQNHVACKDFDVIGLSFPGCPGFPHFGHNEKVAWCVTHAMADYQDLFIEKFNPSDLSEYTGVESSLEANTKKETIKVLDGDDVEITLRSTHHGPIIADSKDGSIGLAFSYTSTWKQNQGFECFLPQMTAQSAQEAEDAMRKWVDPCNNYMFADSEGNIGYLNRGTVPIRSSQNAWLPVPGWTGENDWKEVIPFEELPRSINPSNGYIVTANNKIVGGEYPYYLALDYAPEYRAKRILQRIKNLTSATVEDMLAIHAERTSIPASVYISHLKSIETKNSLESKALEILNNWNLQMDPDSVGASIYSAFRLKLHVRLLSNILGPLSDGALGAGGRGAPSHINHLCVRFVTGAANNDTSLLPDGEDWDAVVTRAFTEGIIFLSDTIGSDTTDWEWGVMHKTQPAHLLSSHFPNLSTQLDPPAVSLGGDGDTPQAGSFSIANPFVMTGTSVARYVFDISNWDNSRWIVPLGSSGHPGSPHYSDQADKWSKVDTIRMDYSELVIESNAATVQLLIPS